ncbi:hypothetical protein ACGFZP_21930 [Kitasatospora sp. NPDC048239]
MVHDRTREYGVATVVPTEDRPDGGHTDVWYQVRLDSLRIDGREDPPSR